ncbi:single-stranded DNA-binding protein [Rarobacter faecitabidus]|uniref:Single-stranded DNA-binding protein n=1 Tax=Rarobacter faecitabidus TaxID=13243 RepID=A0A542ZWP0_RARFA|nr:single-stranded DNA-binding protein [Rarobacter faecitabidus]TQL64752.1 single stranded DNA-binding protein [Rarobacter faecitabidus]
MTNRRSELTIHGWAGTTPELRETANHNKVASFRIADSVRQRDGETGNWIDAKTTWYTVRMWGRLAENVAESVRKSDPVVVTGHPWLETWTNADGEPVTQLVIDAYSIGPDLNFGTSRYSRTVRIVEELGKGNNEAAEAAVDDVAGDSDRRVDAETGELTNAGDEELEVDDTLRVPV